MSAAEYRSGLISEYFSHYGFVPDPGVTEALLTAIGAPGQEGIISSEVGAFVNAFDQIQKAAASDPMTQILADENAALSADTASATDAASKLQDVYTKAPKLFGALTPDQIDQYLAPAKSAFDYSFGAEEGAASKRGLTGSSVEANALATAGTQFNQNVLQAGLNVGMNQQQNQAGVLQNLFNEYMRSRQGMAGLVQGTGQGISQQKYANAQFLAQLPLLLNAMATQQMQINQQAADAEGGSFLEKFGGTLAGFLLGGPIGGNIGGNIGSAITGDPTGARLGAAINPVAGLLGTDKSAQYTPQQSPLMQLPNLMSMFGNHGGGGRTSMPSGMVPDTSGITMGTAGSSLLPPGLSAGTAGGAAAAGAPAGLNWASQAASLLGAL